MTAGQPAPATSRLRRPTLGLLAVLGVGVAWGAYAATEALRPLPFQFVVAPLAIALSIVAAVCLLIAGAVAGALHRPCARQWLYRAAGLAFAGTILGTVGALAILAPPSTSP